MLRINFADDLGPIYYYEWQLGWFRNDAPQHLMVSLLGQENPPELGQPRG